MFIQTLHLMSKTLPAVPLETKTDDSQTIVRRATKFIQKVPILEHKSMNSYDVERFQHVRKKGVEGMPAPGQHGWPKAGTPGLAPAHPQTRTSTRCVLALFLVAPRDIVATPSNSITGGTWLFKTSLMYYSER